MIDKYEFQDLFDLDEVQHLTDVISMALEVGIVIVSPDGLPITKPSNFCDFCKNLIRETEIGSKNCEYSDSILGRKSDKPVVSRCLSAGLVDAGVSIVINGKHLASWMIGQVILEGEEMSELEQQERAKLLGIEEEIFMEGLKKVPRKSKEQFERILEMIHVLAMQLSQLGLKNYVQKEELAYQIQLEEDLRREKAHLEYYSKYDELTGVFSRSYFEEKLDEICQKGEYPIAIISGDMNNLKMMNDVFGHQYGDYMLENLGEILRKEAKPSYIIGRCGGDEFGIVIPFVAKDEAEDYCNRVNQACQNTKECMVPPTVAFGYQVMESAYEEVRKVMKTADEIMYKAKMQKKQGQNINSEILEVLFYRNYLSREQIKESVERIERFAKYANLDEHEIEILKFSAQIQDVGLIAVPEAVVKKQGLRTPEEKAEMEKHTEIGYRLAKMYEESFPVAKIILQSHECWHGLGYPNHLKGNEILYEARFLYLVTAYSYWVYPKTNHVSLEPKIARERLKEQAGKQFDPVLTEQFLEYLEKQEPVE
ncbi:MAG: diguanylate cyclase [Lachnospiraceae bacterium]|nr:diguanylate cyclase [Lachnospiraceae bacterium]